jgi:hypothetical protein
VKVQSVDPKLKCSRLEFLFNAFDLEDARRTVESQAQGKGFQGVNTTAHIHVTWADKRKEFQAYIRTLWLFERMADIRKWAERRCQLHLLGVFRL